MKQWIMIFGVVGVLVGCSSTPDAQKPATIEDRTPSADVKPVVPKPDAGPTAKAATSDKIGVDPLKDPANILSRRSVFFDYNEYTVKEEFKPLVSAHARYLSQNRNARATIQGNTDDRGSREYNLALGQRRADAVKQMMTLLGATASQIETVSFGKEKPRAQGANEQAWAENRRADIVHQGE